MIVNSIDFNIGAFYDPSDKAVKLFESGNWVFSLNLSNNNIEIYSLFYGYLAAFMREGNYKIFNDDDLDLKSILIKENKAGRRIFEIDNLVVALDGFDLCWYGYKEKDVFGNLSILDIAYYNKNYDFDQKSIKGLILKTPIDKVDNTIKANSFITTTLNFRFHNLEQVFYIRDNHEIIGSTDRFGNIKLHSLQNYHIDFDEDKKWIMHITHKQKTTNVFLFEGLVNVVQIKVQDDEYFLKRGKHYILDDYKDLLSEIDVNVVNYNDNRKWYSNDFSEIKISTTEIYVNEQVVGSLEHLSGGFLREDNRLLVKFSKQFSEKEQLMLFKAVKSKFPNKQIVTYLEEDLV